MTRTRWAGSVALALVTVLVGIAPGRAGAEQFTEAEQQVIALLPPGYTAASCTRADNAFPAALASLDCTDDMHTDTPDYARFTHYDSMDALTADFYVSAAGMSLSPCPDGNASPGTWNYGPHLTNPGGKIACGTVDDQTVIAWTRDSQLLLATVNGGPDLGELYQWWQRYGAATG
ncbi:hypothetical protein C0J29_17325 [Mycobacterium paragordonae]|uniref:Serine/threonine protein kinase n=1 Tax=Mycobacterium paragordonae TaxID=1389713 RepID=A0ABQ1C5I5_9MYCO|nr:MULTISPECIES: hypothetical protein [Mycobacterium]AYE96301.1 hypothetical protein C0J29_17325 [Mycobacterium paragordonae]OBJ76058.1 hypothetical protein A9W97_08135 [Mycobacterium gordonae]OBK54928.1 hypothetical protein A5656_21835 [Mycobacterium gordonae]GFG79710.1 hypothetical protein MPRG_29860 [Mycobacterium paragordonae]